MSKLNNNIRQAMASKLVAYRYEEEAKELVHLTCSLGERVYAHCYTPEVVAAMELIRKKFPAAFNKHAGINVNAGGFRVMVGDKIHSRWVVIKQSLPVERLLYDGWNAHDISGDVELVKEVKEFAIRVERFHDVCATAYQEALSVLNTMTTGKKLAEAWPEAMDVIGDLIPEGARTLPVVQVSAINAKFKLPPKKKGKA